jgi:DNA polymerase
MMVRRTPEVDALKANETVTVRHQLATAYERERKRLSGFAKRDEPQGEYAFPVFGEGGVSSGVMLIGEAPGAEETKQGRPFVGRAGKQLDALFASFGIARDGAYITNVVKYRPVVRAERTLRNRTPKPAEVGDALRLLEREIMLIRPRVVLTLGNTPLKAVLCLCKGTPGVIGDLHGERISLTVDDLPFELIPLYHPASGIYNRKLVAVMERDAERVGVALRELSPA